VIPTKLDEKHVEALKSALPDRQFNEVEIGPPPGMEESVGSLDAVVTKDEEGQIRVHTFWKPEEGEIEALQNGGVIELTIHADHLHPISGDIWGSGNGQ